MLEVYTRFLDGEMRGRRKRDFLHLLALGCAYLHLKFLKNFVDVCGGIVGDVDGSTGASVGASVGISVVTFGRLVG